MGCWLLHCCNCYGTSLDIGVVLRQFSQFADSELKLVGLKLVKPSKLLAQKHYKLLKDKFFYAQIVDYLTGKFHGGYPVVAFVLQGKAAIEKCRFLFRAT